jgi:hypothetical protein
MSFKTSRKVLFVIDHNGQVYTLTLIFSNSPSCKIQYLMKNSRAKVKSSPYLSN